MAITSDFGSENPGSIPGLTTMDVHTFVSNIQLEFNPVTHGCCCEFEYDDKEYYADVSLTFDRGYECMIFPKGSWSEVYQKLTLGVSPDILRDCIEEFITDEERKKLPHTEEAQ